MIGQKQVPVAEPGPGPRLSALLIVALCAWAFAVAPAGAAGGHQLIGTITGQRIEPLEQFKGACGVAVDRFGDVYVADHYNNRVAVFDRDWKYLTQITTVNPLDPAQVAPLDGPCDLAVDSLGRLYVNNYHREIVRYTPTQFPPQAGTAYGSRTVIDSRHPTGVAVEPASDRVLVNARTHVAVYEPSGAPAISAGEELRIGTGSLGDSYGVSVSAFVGDAQYPSTAGLIYVADAATSTVKVYDPALDLDAPQQEIHGAASAEGRFYLTDADLAVDPGDGHLYVSNNLEPHFEERPEAVVAEFSPLGRYRGSVPEAFADGFPSFLHAGEPSGLAVGPDGILYVSSGNDRNSAVYAFGPPAPASTHELTVAKTGAGEGAIASIPAGLSCGPVCVGEFEHKSQVVLKATPELGSEFTGWGPGACDQEPAPTRCIVDVGSDRTVGAVFEPSGGSVSQISSSSSPHTSSTPAAAPTGGAASGAAPQSQTVQKNDLRVSLDGRLSPTRLPRSGLAPIAISVDGRIAALDGSPLPQLRRLRIEFNRGGRLQSRGLPACSLSQIAIASSEAALRSCRSALVGRGRFDANIVLSGQDPYPSTAQLLLFNGRRNGGEVMLGHIYSKEPFATSFVIVFTVSHRSRGRYRTILTASMPEALGDWGYLTRLSMRLSRRYRAGGIRRSYLSAGCPLPPGVSRASFPLARASFSFAGGIELARTLTRVCMAR